MKNLKLIGFLMILASSLMFIQCTSDPIEGPQGLAGIDGVDGTDGVDGVDGTAECVSCHNLQNKEHVVASYLTSVHAQETWHETKDSNGNPITLSTSDYGNRTGCVECHTSGGYIDKMNGVTLKTGAGVAAFDPAYPAGEQTISCTTCHNKHSTFDFANDGYDFALRQALRPVALTAPGANYTIDMGSSNTCVNCHQPRGLPPTTETVKLNSRFGPHHGPQSTLLEGIQGALIVGSTAYPVPGAATHRTGASCASCHMGEPSSETAHDGLHSWHPTDKTCLTCHTSVPSGVAGFDADMATLEGLLVTKGAFSTASDAFTSNTVDLVVAQAAWNFGLLREDRSKGIHNPNYAKALLKNSIEALQ